MRRLMIDSLPDSKTWIDRDEIMLHSCFQILKDFIEKEIGDTHMYYEEHKKEVDELRELYNWWMIRKDVETDLENWDDDQTMLKRLIEIRLILWT